MQLDSTIPSVLCACGCQLPLKKGQTSRYLPGHAGRPVRSLAERFRAKVIVDSEDSCWMFTGSLCGKGYGQITAGRRGALLAHRVAWELAYGEVPADMLVCHTCDTPRCVNPKHLFLGTYLDNAVDMVKKGRQAQGATSGFRLHPELVRTGARHWMHLHPERIARGQRHGMAKLSDAQAEEIVRLRQEGISAHDLALLYFVSESNVRLIVSGKTWSHISRAHR